MAQVSGSDIVVAMYDETAWGDDPGTPDGRLLYLTALNLTAQQNLIDSAIISGGRGTSRPGQGNIAVAGSLRTEIAPENVGWLLKHLLGAPTASGSDPYTHAYVPGALPEGFQIEKDYTAAIASKVERYQGCRMQGATLTFPQEGFCTAEFNIVGKSQSINTTVLDATLTDPGHEGFTGFEGTLKEGGTELGAAMSGTLVIDNSIRDDLYTFSSAGERYALPEGRCKISGEVQLVFDSFSLFDKATARTETTFEFILSRGDGLGSAGNESLSLLVDHADITRTSPPLETESGIIVTLQYTGFASGSDMGLVATLKNAVASH